MKLTNLESEGEQPPAERFCLPFPNREEITVFADFYSREFGKTLTYEEAKETATRLLHIHWVLSLEGRVNPKDWPKE